jgi:hypothetical protein
VGVRNHAHFLMKNEFQIKDFLKAKTPQALQKLMLLNSIDTASYHDYRIMFVAPYWYAWFEIDGEKLLSKEYNGIDKQSR